MTFIAWPEIESFHNIRKFIRIDPTEWWRAKEQLGGTSVVSYKCKVKLHGTNAAVHIHMDGTVTVQSRTGIITPENDNAGFARWVKANENEWRKTAAVPTKDNPADHYLDVIYYGEWIGPGIQKGVAVSEIPKKCFAVFAMQFPGKDGLPRDDFFEVRPERIAMYLGKSGVKFVGSEEANLPDVYILPWYKRGAYHDADSGAFKDAVLDIDWKRTDEQLTQDLEEVNDWVADVEHRDPWVQSTFGVTGTGEGLVFYPVSKPHLGYENFTNLCFKAKGEKHKNIATAKPAQVSAEAAASIDGFVELVLTPARLEQGAKAVGGTMIQYQNQLVQGGPEVTNFDLKLTGKFVAWVSADVEKETQDELAASGLTWKEVQKPISDKARTWYLAQAKK